MPSERRISLVAIAATVSIFALLLALTPSRFPTFDEAKYLGIGHTFLAGGGTYTIFGEVFLPHSPLWSALLAIGDGRLGGDRYALGRLLNVLSTVAFLGLVGWFAWSIRPYAAALAVAAFLWVPALMFNLAVTARLDVPAAALALLYVAVGVVAIRRDSIPLALLAGFVFGLGFLVKEIVLPLAPVPILVGLAERRGWPWLARASGLIALVAMLTTSWWFLTVLDVSGRVYRLDTPGWTLLPLTAILLVASVLGISAPWLMARRQRGPATGDRPGRAPLIAAWGLALAWFALLTLFFSQIGELKGNGLFQPRQYELYLTTWLSGAPEMLAVAGMAVGSAFAVMAWISLARRAARDEGEDRRLDAFRLIALASLCSLPLVLLVIAVGEPPRNFLAQIGLAVAFATGGWVIAASWAVARLRAMRPAAGRVLGRWAPVAAVAVIVGVVALGSVRMAVAARALPTATDRLSSEAVSTVGAWVRDNVAPDARIGIGQYLSYNLALELPGRELTQVQQQLAVFDARAPLALATATSTDVDDWIAADTSRRALEFYAYRGSALAAQIEADQLDTLVYATAGPTSVPSLVGALTPDHGFELLQHWTWPLPGAESGADAIDAYVYAIDRERLTFDDATLSISPAALQGLVELLEAAPDAATAAANLRQRVDVIPPSPETDGLLRRLDRLAAPGG